MRYLVKCCGQKKECHEENYIYKCILKFLRTMWKTMNDFSKEDWRLVLLLPQETGCAHEIC